MISSDATQSQAEMFGGQGQTEPIIGPLPELPPPPSASSDSGSTDVEQYHVQCTTSNILSCVPECNATHHGFELLATIDGTDTKFSCNLANQLFSWVGAAALGGFLGQNVAAFVSAVISGAAGTYVLTLMEDAGVGTDLVVQPGQNVIISGDAGLAVAPRWGSGGVTVGEMGSLLLTHVSLGASTITMNSGGALGLSSMAVPAAVLAMLADQLSGAGSRLLLSAVTVPTYSVIGGELTVTMVVGTNTSRTIEPPEATVAFGGLLLPCCSISCDGSSSCRSCSNSCDDAYGVYFGCHCGALWCDLNTP
jgi:hypothetical protein